ncbi:hypothetical protein K1719_046168 [Acacia pycnantha]|nr:hypothetical protein K1719_046168 [Acacia pycnantha]
MTERNPKELPKPCRIVRKVFSGTSEILICCRYAAKVPLLDLGVSYSRENTQKPILLINTLEVVGRREEPSVYEIRQKEGEANVKDEAEESVVVTEVEVEGEISEVALTVTVLRVTLLGSERDPKTKNCERLRALAMHGSKTPRVSDSRLERWRCIPITKCDL